MTKHGFVIGELLGQGAFGTVYQAHQTALGRPVAVKFFDKRLMATPANMKRFRREALLLARIDHPSVPYVITTGIVTRDDRIIDYMVMKFVKGRSLDTIIRGRTRLPPERAVEIIIQILGALSAAHAVEVIHRDIKPDNIIVGSTTTTLLDFSLGFCREHVAGLSRTTRVGEAMGVPQYCAPEQMANAESVDARADIYSTGVVLFEMLTGHTNVKSLAVDQSLMKVSPPVRAAIARALNTDLERRFQTAESFRDALATGRSVPRMLNEPVIAVCTNPECEGARIGQRGYLQGPRVISNCTDTFCDSCGDQLLRNCQGCRELFGTQILERLQAGTKFPQSLAAHCGSCGTKVFQVPTCSRCKSFLKQAEVGSDTMSAGCSKCRASEVRATPTEADIPF